MASGPLTSPFISNLDERMQKVGADKVVLQNNISKFKALVTNAGTKNLPVRNKGIPVGRKRHVNADDIRQVARRLFTSPDPSEEFLTLDQENVREIMEELERENNRLNEEIRDLKREIQRERSRRKKAESDNLLLKNELKEKRKEVERQGKEIVTLRNELNEKGEEIGTLRDELSEKGEQIDRIGGELQATNEVIRQLRADFEQRFQQAVPLRGDTEQQENFQQVATTNKPIQNADTQATLVNVQQEVAPVQSSSRNQDQDLGEGAHQPVRRARIKDSDAALELYQEYVHEMGKEGTIEDIVKKMVHDLSSEEFLKAKIKEMHLRGHSPTTHRLYKYIMSDLETDNAKLFIADLLRNADFPEDLINHFFVRYPDISNIGASNDGSSHTYYTRSKSSTKKH